MPWSLHWTIFYCPTHQIWWEQIPICRTFCPWPSPSQPTSSHPWVSLPISFLLILVLHNSPHLLVYFHPHLVTLFIFHHNIVVLVTVPTKLLYPSPLLVSLVLHRRRCAWLHHLQWTTSLIPMLFLIHLYDTSHKHKDLITWSFAIWILPLI